MPEFLPLCLGALQFSLQQTDQSNEGGVAPPTGAPGKELSQSLAPASVSAVGVPFLFWATRS